MGCDGEKHKVRCYHGGVGYSMSIDNAEQRNSKCRREEGGKGLIRSIHFIYVLRHSVNSKSNKYEKM